MQKLDEEFLANGGEFKSFKAQDLFTIKSNPQLNKESFVFSDNGEYPYFTRTVLNNGIAGYVEYLNDENKIKGNCLAVGMLGMQFFYMEKDFYAGQFTKSVYPNRKMIIRFNSNIAQYFIVLLNRFSSLYQGVLVRNFEKTFYDTDILVPLLKDEISLEYMEKYIHILQLEKFRSLKNYIAENNLENLSLTDEEKTAIGVGRDWQAFRIGDLFNRIAQGARLTKQDQIKGDLPFVMSGITETGVVAKIGNSKNEFPSNSLTIDIFGNVFYRSFRFGASDDVGVYWNDDKQIDKLAMLFIGCSIQTALTGQFSYGYKLRSSKSSDLTCFLPVKNNEPDYEYMATFIKAIQKQVIKPVVEFTQKQLAEN